MNPEKGSVDVAVSAYGKPYQTAVTLLTLMKHSGQWIDKIYFVEEKKQPEIVSYKFLYKIFTGRIIRYKPLFWFAYDRIGTKLRRIGVYRRAIRYQYAWEKTNKKYLLLIHNDMYFKDDLVGQYLMNIGDHTGIGKVGQCWNCPAHSAGRCSGENYLQYRPDYNEIMEMSAQYPGPRSPVYEAYIDRNTPWPLPECRLNEYVSMINIKKARPATAPFGKATPIGSNNAIDTGVEWFRDVSRMGHTFRHFDYEPYATHSWVSLRNSGHEALFNSELYKYEESVALQCLMDEFNYKP
ncbi:hypothetical protein [Dyadobacter sp. CY323]|uniref:hypothetical protein n=1 Tax=Dyadobacter sp. CY323 TaxID=2907302 RepID=UPI001F32370D|nr:hypothetical protein [Dyadobacter sp. CY323]MCE6989336.1 hypothetical protein [Dyadobacter sp. CY323]